jgi:Ca2+-binding RTX toxin-like protein
MAKIITNGSKGGRIDGTRKDDVINGEGGNDRIGAHRGDDLIDGGAGNDKIHGSQDHDTMTGGAGRDMFIFREFAAKDSDHITDFKHGIDHLGFDRSVFDHSRGKLSSDEFVLGTAAKDGNDHFIYDSTTGNLYYDDDGKGGHKQHLIATLDNHDHTNLTASDILFI